MKVLFEVIKGTEGYCLTVGDDDCSHRLAGPKPYGGGTIVHRFEVDVAELQRELECCVRASDDEVCK